MKKIVQRYWKSLVALQVAIVCIVGSHAADTDFPYVKGEVIVKMSESMTLEGAKSFASAFGFDVKQPMTIPGFFLLKLKDSDGMSETLEKTIIQEKLDAIRQSGLVKDAFLNYIYETHQNPNDPLLGTSVNSTNQQWNLFQIGLPDPGGAWDTERGLPGVIVTTMDTWYWTLHSDFYDQFGENRFITGYNAFNANNDVLPLYPPDVLGFFTHGTMVASVIVAGTNNNQLMAGVTWEGVKLLPIVICNNSPGQGLVFSAILQGYQYILDYNAANDENIIALSMSYGGGSPNSQEEQFLNRIANDGTIPLASSGNSRPFPAGWPASYKSVVSVAATRWAAGTKGIPTSYSSPGSSDGVRKVDIAAPSADDAVGVGVIALAYDSGATGGGGTSYSCPTAAGAVALLYSAGFARDDIINVLKETGVTNPVSNKPNLDTGYGEIDVAAAMALLVPYAKPLVPQQNQTFTFQTVPFEFRLFKVQMAGPNAPVVEIETQSGSFTDTVSPSQYSIVPDTINPNVFYIRGEVRLFDGIYDSDFDDDWIIRVSGVDAATNTVPVIGEVKVKIRLHKFVAYNDPGTNYSMISIPYGLGGIDAPPGGYKPEDMFGAVGVDFNLLRWVPLGLDTSGNPLGTYALYTGGDNTQDAGFTPTSAEIIKTTQSGSTLVKTPQNGPWGVGWWLIQDLGATKSLAVEEGAEEGVINYRIKLIPGWNQIGNPYAFYVDWNNCQIVVQSTFGEKIYSIKEAVAAGIIREQIYRYELKATSSGLVKEYSWRGTVNGQLVPFESHWVRANHECWLQVPPHPAVERSVYQEGNIVRGQGWATQLSVEARGSQKDSTNFFGATKDFNPETDTVLKPPVSPYAPMLAFLSSQDGMTPLAQDLREISSGKETYRVIVVPDKSNTQYTIRWKEVVRASRKMSYTLLDEATGQSMVMRPGSTYSFTSDENATARFFTITATPETPGRLVISSVRVGGGARSGYTIQYTLSVAANVQVRVLSNTGKLVADLESMPRAAGTATVVWNGRDNRGASVAPGVYMVQILAETANGERVRTTTPVTVTR